MGETFVFAAFRSRQQMLEFESRINAAGIATRIITTPPGLAQGCGLSVRMDETSYAKAKTILESYRPHSFVGFYRASQAAGRMVYEPLMRRGTGG